MAHTRAQLHFDPPYDSQLEGILEFASFSAAEITLFKLEKLRQGYRTVGDMKGVEYCRRLGLLGRRRAELIGLNRKVKPQKRLQKLEISAWFRVWLESPELFEDWLSLRKRTPEFGKLCETESSGHVRG